MHHERFKSMSRTLNYGLFSLQHRGQESCGIVVGDDGLFRTYKDQGLVGDVFTPQISTLLSIPCPSVFY